MSEENLELAREGIAALNEAYTSGDVQPWRRQLEKAFDPDVVLEAGEAFTEGEWRGHEGAVGFVANQMEVLEDMSIRVDEYVDVDESSLIVAITFGGRARHTGIPVELHLSTSSGCVVETLSGGRSSWIGKKPSKPPVRNSSPPAQRNA